MSEHTYTKSITNDFGGNFNSTNLKNEIESNGIARNLLRIDRIGDVVKCVFDGSLTTSEETTLTTSVTNHDTSVDPTYSNTINNVLRDNEYKDKSYKRCCTFIYEGTSKIQPITKINAIGYMDEDVDSYSILVEDKTNGNIIAENTFTNTEETDIELTPINNIPTTKSRIEVSIKKTGGKNKDVAYVESITFYLAA